MTLAEGDIVTHVNVGSSVGKYLGHERVEWYSPHHLTGVPTQAAEHNLVKLVPINTIIPPAVVHQPGFTRDEVSEIIKEAYGDDQFDHDLARVLFERFGLDFPMVTRTAEVVVRLDIEMPFDIEDAVIEDITNATITVTHDAYDEAVFEVDYIRTY